MVRVGVDVVVYEDVLDGIVSAETALNVYGVVIKNAYLNIELTEKRRKYMLQQRNKLPLFSQ